MVGDPDDNILDNAHISLHLAQTKPDKDEQIMYVLFESYPKQLTNIHLLLIDLTSWSEGKILAMFWRILT